MKFHSLRRSGHFLIFASLFLGGLGSTPATARVYQVNSTLDAVDANPGDGHCATETRVCTLRAAVQESNALRGADTILLPAGTYRLTLGPSDEDAAAGGDLDIYDQLTIRGSGKGETIIDGNDKDRVFHILRRQIDRFDYVSSVVDIEQLTVQNGNARVVRSEFGHGGGIYNNQGLLRMKDVELRDNTASSGGAVSMYVSGTRTLLDDADVVSNIVNFSGGGIKNGRYTYVINSSIKGNQAHDGGGIYGGSYLHNSTVDGNQAELWGGGVSGCGNFSKVTISNNSSKRGGGVVCGGEAFFSDVTIKNNSAEQYGGGISAGGTSLASRDLTLRNTTISGNTAGYGGGISDHGDLTLLNVTVSGNSAATVGGGIYAALHSNNTSLTNSTLSNNTAPEDGANIYNDNGTIRPKNTIIAHPSGAANCGGEVESQGFNIADDGSCNLVSEGDRPNTDPKLGPLADNGAFTPTHALLDGSPAANHGSNSACPKTDQRHRPRVDGACDMGAYERTGGDYKPGALSLDAAGYRVEEGSAELAVQVNRTGGSDGDITVDYMVWAGNTDSGDMEFPSGTLEWLAGDTTPRTITIPIKDDSEEEYPEVFTVLLGYPTGGADLGEHPYATGTILDDEATYKAAAMEPVRIAVAADGATAITTLNWDGAAIVLADRDGHAAWSGMTLTDRVRGPFPTSGSDAWFDPKDGLLYVAVPTSAGLLLYRRDTAGEWSHSNLTEQAGEGTTPIISGLTHYLSPDLARDFDGNLILDSEGNPIYPIPEWERNNVYLAGRNGDGDLVLYFQQRFQDGGDSLWAYTNITRDHLIPQGQPLPDWTGDLVGYATPWNGQNIAGVDPAGRITAVWTAPDRAGVWSATNLSDDYGTPPLAGGLSAYVNRGINLTGVLPGGRLGVTWWSAELEEERKAEGRSDYWAFTDLTGEALGPLLRPDSVTNYTTPDHPSNNIVGLTEDDRLVVYWWAPDNGDRFEREWQVEDLTAALPEAPLPKGKLGAAAARDGSASILGMGDNGDILRYLRNPEGVWSFQNVTGMAKEGG